jgi:hypothetical protein
MVGQDFLQSLEAIVTEGLLKEVRVNERAAMKADPHLLLVEVDIVLAHDFLFRDRVDIEEIFANLAANEVIFDDLFDVADLHLVVESVFREDLDERSLAAEAEAADVVDADFFFESAFFDLLFELLRMASRVVG